MHIACRHHLQTRKARDVGVAYNGRSQRPGQLWAAGAGRGREKRTLANMAGPGRARPVVEKERLGLARPARAGPGQEKELAQ